MLSSEALQAIEAAFASAAGATGAAGAPIVVWADEGQPYFPGIAVRLALRNVQQESIRTDRGTVTIPPVPPAKEPTTADTVEIGQACIFKVNVTIEGLRNPEESVEFLVRLIAFLHIPSLRAAQTAAGIELVTPPEVAVATPRMVDNRILNSWDFSTEWRAVVTHTVLESGDWIETVTGEGTITPGPISLPFTAVRPPDPES